MSAEDSPSKSRRPMSIMPISVFKPGKAEPSNSFLDSIESPYEQLELFLWKFKDIIREEIEDRLKEFLKFDKGKRGELGNSNFT